jgi:hypothetical protein
MFDDHDDTTVPSIRRRHYPPSAPSEPPRVQAAPVPDVQPPPLAWYVVGVLVGFAACLVCVQMGWLG